MYRASAVFVGSSGLRGSTSLDSSVMDGAQEEPREGNDPVLGHAICAKQHRRPASHAAQPPDKQPASPNLGQVAELEPATGRRQYFTPHDLPYWALVSYRESIFLVPFNGGASPLAVVSVGPGPQFHIANFFARAFPNKE
jgi:hypothetical protein